MICRSALMLNEPVGDQGMVPCPQDPPTRIHRLLRPVIVVAIPAEVIEAAAVAVATTIVDAAAPEAASMMTGTVSASGAAPTTVAAGPVNETTAIEEIGIPRIRTACFTGNLAVSASCCRTELGMSCRGLNKPLENLRSRQRKTRLRRPSHHRLLRLEPSQADNLRMPIFNR